MSEASESDPLADGPPLSDESPCNPFADAQEPPKPLNVPPPSVNALRADCEGHRARILDAIRQGQDRFYACSNQNFAMLLKGAARGYLLPSFGRLFDAGLALDLDDAPPFTGEPQTGRDGVALLDSLIQWCAEKLQQPAVADSKQKFRQPPDDALKCYRLLLATGWKQAHLAETLSRELHRPIDQPTVSRWLTQVKTWLQGGNVLPDLTADSGPKPKIVPMDPAKIDGGAGRQKSIRKSRTADKDAELEKLIAEQQSDDD